MTEIIPFALLLYPLEFLVIQIDFLWRLVLIFGGLAALFFILIFYFRSHLVASERNVHARKSELTPLIRNYLLQEAESIRENETDLQWMKMEIRNFLKNPLDRKVIVEIMLEVQRDGLPETRQQISALYQYFGLHDKALQQLESRKWDQVSQAISELTEMQVSQAYEAIREHINSKNSVVRKQAQLATVQLKEEGIQYFLDTARYPISQWQQVKILEILTSKSEYKAPGFRDWLISENHDVIVFTLRLIRVFRQQEARQALLMFLNHRSERIQIAAVECIGDFRYDAARLPLITCYRTASAELKIHILRTLQAIGNTADIPWIEEQARTDTSFLVRSKARLVFNALQPVVGLTELGIQGESELWALNATNNSMEPESVLPIQDTLEEEATEDLFSSESVLIHTLKPDFTTALRPDEPGSTRTVAHDDLEGILLETPVELNLEAWTEEHELVFGDCIIEELLDILSNEPASNTTEQVLPEFLPWVINVAENASDYTPNHKEPQWVRELEVEVELLSGATGYAGILREILLEELRETERVLETEFVPGTGNGGPPDHEEENLEEGDFSNMLFPEFAVDSEDIYLSEESPIPDDGKRHAPSDLKPFSIFYEFFRSYDAESKLILMDQIYAVGGKKELVFLKSLFEDPDSKIRLKARKEYALLNRKLNTNTTQEETDECPNIWLPSGGADKSDPPRSAVESSEFDDLNFLPDQDFDIQSNRVLGKDLHTESDRGYNRFLNHIKGAKNNTDA